MGFLKNEAVDQNRTRLSSSKWTRRRKSPKEPEKRKCVMFGKVDGCKEYFWTTHAIKKTCSPLCKKARSNETSLKYYHKNSDKLLEKARENYYKDHEKSKEHWRKNYWKDPEKMRKKSKENYHKDPEKSKEKTRAWVKNNPENIKKYLSRYYYKYHFINLMYTQLIYLCKKDEKNETK